MKNKVLFTIISFLFASASFCQVGSEAVLTQSKIAKVQYLQADSGIVIKQKDTASWVLPQAGAIAFYGGKLFFNDGTKWKKLTSAPGKVTYDFTIDFTTGTARYLTGTGSDTAVLASVGTNGSDSTLLLTPFAVWKSIDDIVDATKMTVYSNVVVNDAPGNTTSSSTGAITVWRRVAYKSAINSATQSQCETVYFTKTGAALSATNTVSVIPDGSLSSPAVIGDKGTISVSVASSTSTNLGLGGVFGRYYYSFGFQIPSGAKTKVYKFRIELEYN